MNTSSSSSSRSNILDINNREPGDVLQEVLLCVLMFCIVVLVVVTGVQSSLLSRCIVVLFFFVVLVVAISAGGVQSSSSSLSFVHRSSFVVSSSACHRPSLLVAITVYCCFVLFRVAVLVLVHVVVVFIASDFLSRFLKRDGGLNLSLRLPVVKKTHTLSLSL